MELYFLATGVKHHLDNWETYMQSMMFNQPYKDKNGNPQIQATYGMLEPIKLYRFIFPKEYRDRVLKTFNLPNGKYPGFNGRAEVLRRIMKAQKIPTPDEKALPMPFCKLPIAIQGIGIKEDKEFVNQFGNTQEGL